ncbi:MAG TPA: hypothetical protein VFD82_21765 [Planctomycetota bacterium]|nr:hypothetical protein [Planctomycetota bacterium]
MKTFESTSDRITRESRAEGKAEGAVTLLHQALQRRFGAIPRATAARLAKASRADMNRWVERALRQEAIDAVSLHLLKVTKLSRRRLRTVFEQHIGGSSVKKFESTYDRITRESRAEGKAEGKAEGRAEGAAALLHQLLQRRFGPIPKATAARLAKASNADVSRWAARVLDAATLAEVFAD